MYLLIGTLFIAGAIAVFVSSRQTLKRAVAELRQQLDSLSTRVRALEQDADDRTSSSRAESHQLDSAGLSPPIARQQVSEQITPETLATITETITALLGRKISVRSVKMLATPDVIVNPWAQQGRAVIQASHNFSQRKREP